MEGNGSPVYTSAYRIHHLWGHHYEPRRKPYQEITEKKEEYTYTHHFNNLGFRGKTDMDLVKGAEEYRILTLGDSFTEGSGASDDSTWSKLLEDKLNSNNSGALISVLNGGRAGSDPVFSLRFLKQNHEELGIDMVLLAINSSDVEDIVNRGGRDRYSASGKLKLRKGPYWEIFYSFSFIVRHIVHDMFDYNRSLIQEKDYSQEYQYAIDELYLTISDIHAYCNDHQLKFKLIIGPHSYEMYKGSLTWHLHRISEYLINESKVPLVYLPLCFDERIRGEGRQPSYYYWKLDQHHNGRGYELFADCVAEGLEF